MCSRFSAFLLAGLIPALQPAAQDPEPEAGTPVLRELRVPLEGGRLNLADLGRTLLEEYGLDADALELPDRFVDLRGLRGRLTLFATRELLLETVRLRRSADGGELIVTIDRGRAREVRRDLRKRIAQLTGAALDEDLLAREYALELPANLDEARDLVVLVHGIESDPSVWTDLRAYFDSLQQPPQIAIFAYPNDDGIEATAAALAQRLHSLGDQPIVLIGHSMGGVIARVVVESPELDPGNVHELIQIGAPNHGSDLAAMRFALEIAHLAERGRDDEEFGRALLAGFRASLLDGLGEAGGDLMPDSVFLARLGRSERNPTVEYHVVLGTRAVLDAARFESLRTRLESLIGASEGLRILEPVLTEWFGNLDEIVDGKGDGAVSVESGRLEDVDETLVPRDHLGLVRLRGLTGEPLRAEEHPVFLRIAGWLDEE